MASRLGPKGVKRASSTSKKKSSTSTPETSTPTTSGDSIGIEKPVQESTIDDVLVGDEVEALKIKEEDLLKVHPPKPPSAGRPIQHKRKVFVKKNQPSELSHPKEKEVAVLHPLPSGTAVSTTRIIGSMEGGPRFDQRGAFLSHSVLGSATDFASELKSREMVESVSTLVKPPPVVLPGAKKQGQTRAMSYEKTITPREKNSLKFWTESMKQRKNQQQCLSSKVASPPERLLMNHGDTFRSVQEERTLIDRTMPSVSYGKGYRFGSEFWSQHVQIGSQDTGIQTTLTCTEKGLPPELEFVGVPSLVAREKGVASDLERNAPSHYTWDRSAYLSTLKEELSGPLTDTHRPEVSQLLVVGRAPGDEPLSRADSLNSLGESTSSDSDDQPVSVMELQGGDVTTQPIIGPALLINGKLLRWEGLPFSAEPEKPPLAKTRATQSETVLSGLRPRDSTASLREIDTKRVSVHCIPIDFRVCLESETGARVTAFVELENCGTAAVYYSWQPLPKPNPLGTIQAGDTQRFYFDTKGGVLMPGQRLDFPFTFKSPNAGIFSETWLLQTGPVLCRGRQVVFTLKGVASQEDLNKQKREELERELKHRMAEAAVERLINKVVDSIRSPLHTPEPVQIIRTEEHIFKEKNPELHYHHGVVQKLKTLYDSILRPDLLLEQLPVEPSTKSDKSGIGKKDDKASKGKEKTSAKDKKGSKPKEEPIKEVVIIPLQEEEALPPVPDWDMSVTSLREVVLGVEEVTVMETKLKELSALVGLLSFPPPKQVRKSNYNIVYEAVCEAVDRMYDVSTSLCQAMGLPIREFSQKEESGDKHGDTDGQSPSQPVSPALAKDKKGGKDTKKSKPGKDSLRSASSKGKPVNQKRSKPSITAKDADAIKQMMSEASAVIDPVVGKKYTNSFYSSVHEILGVTANKIELLLT